MQELIHISQDNEKFVVSARELYSKLSEDIYHYAQWTRANITNNKFAIKDIDYQPLLKVVIIKGRGRPATNDFMLTMDFAKRISLLSKTKKGVFVRDYFLACEKKAIDLSNTSVAVADKGGLLIDKLILVCSGFLDRLRQIGEPPKQVLLPETATTTITKEEQAKIDAYDAYLKIPANAISIEEAASILKVIRRDGKGKKDAVMGRNLLFKYIRSVGWLNKNNMPIAKFSNLFIVKEVIRNKDTDCVLGIPMTLLTPQGLTELKNQLIKNHYEFADNCNVTQQTQKQKDLFTTDF